MVEVSSRVRYMKEDFRIPNRCWRRGYVIYKENARCIIHFEDDFEERNEIQGFTMSE